MLQSYYMLRESDTLQKIGQSKAFWILSVFILLSIGIVGLAIIWVSQIFFGMKIIFTIAIFAAILPLKYYAFDTHILN